jgi:hypothetical protein
MVDTSERVPSSAWDVPNQDLREPAKCPDRLRRIVVWDADQQRQIEILTNHLLSPRPFG